MQEQTILTAPTNPYYFKSHILNFYYMCVAMVGIGILIFNAFNRRICRKYTSKTALVIHGFLGVPIIVDSIYDIVTDYSADNFSPAALITILCVMAIVAILSVGFFIHSARRCNPTLACKKKGGYQALKSTSDADAKKTEKRDREKKLIYPINMLLLVNVTAAMVLIIVVMTVTYIMRVVSYYDNNKVRELDCLYFAIIVIVHHILFALMDIFWRHTIIGVIFSHHLTLGMYLLSNVLDLHNQQKLIETVSLLGFLLLSIPLMTISVAYFFVMKSNFFNVEPTIGSYSSLMRMEEEEDEKNK